MENSKVFQIAKTIQQQINYGGKNIVWSWGARGYVCGVDNNDEAYLQFRVSGFLHKGLVRVTLNEGKDLYTVQTLKVKGGIAIAIKTVTDVFCEDLTEIIDGLVEKDYTKTDAAYKAQVTQFFNKVDLSKL